MEEKGVSKLTVFIVVLIVGVFACVFGGMRLNGFFDADKTQNSPVQEGVPNTEKPEGAPVNLFLYANQSEAADFFEAGKRIGALLRDKNDKIIAIVDGKYEITKNQVEISLIMQEAYNRSDNLKTPTKKEILEELVKAKVLVGEAIKQNLTVTDAEAKAAIQAPYQQMQEALAKAGDEERLEARKSMALLESLVAGIGMTNEEYLQTIQVPGMKEVLLKQALYDSFVKKLNEEERLDKKISDAKYETYVQRLLAEAKVKRLNGSPF